MSVGGAATAVRAVDLSQRTQPIPLAGINNAWDWSGCSNAQLVPEDYAWCQADTRQLMDQLSIRAPTFVSYVTTCQRNWLGEAYMQLAVTVAPPLVK